MLRFPITPRARPTPYKGPKGASALEFGGRSNKSGCEVVPLAADIRLLHGAVAADHHTVAAEMVTEVVVGVRVHRLGRSQPMGVPRCDCDALYRRGLLRSQLAACRSGRCNRSCKPVRPAV